MRQVEVTYPRTVTCPKCGARDVVKPTIVGMVSVAVFIPPVLCSNLTHGQNPDQWPVMEYTT